jgi:nitrogenase iron protein NifH
MTYHIALCGKGGVGKTTLAANISAALVEAGLSVMLVGCDAKCDSSALLNGGYPIPDVLSRIRSGRDISVESVVHSRFKNVSCVELGDPFQQGTCASSEIALAFGELHQIRLFESVAPDFVIYDVTGGSSCARLLAPIRQFGLDRLFVVTSADYMSLHAANSIFTFVDRFGDSNVPVPIGGLIPNGIASSFEESFISDFAKHTRINTFGKVPRSQMVRQCELYGKTVIESAPLSNQAYYYRRLANQLVDASHSGNNVTAPQPMNPEQLRSWALEWGDRIHALENGLVTDGAAI